MNERIPKEINDILKEDMDNVIKNINTILTSNNITQRELAFRMNTDPPHINMILRGNTGITLKVLGRIAIALEVPISRFFEKQPKK